MSLHPEIEAFLDLVEFSTLSGNRLPLEEMPASQARKEFEHASPLLDTAPEELLVVEDRQVITRDGHKIGVRIYSDSALNKDTPLPATMYMHGGGYTVGSIDSHDILCRSLCKRSGYPVVSVGYRLAPEHKFPTAFEDVSDVYQWLQQDSEGIDPANIVIAGDSAGATLATTLCIEASTRSDWHCPVLQVLIYPVTASEMNSPSHQEFAEGYLLERSTLEWFYQNYLTDPQQKQDWRFAPGQAKNLTQQPPALVLVAEYDPLADEARSYAQQLENQGNDVECKTYAGMTHDFIRMGSMVSEAAEAQQQIAERIKNAFQD